MEVVLAENHGFCFGVKRAIKIAEEHQNVNTYGPLIHNGREIDRLRKDYGVGVVDEVDSLAQKDSVIVRTHGIQKQDLEKLRFKEVEIIDATCPYVKKPQNIAEEMSAKGYAVVIFGDRDHPEVKGVMSYASEEPLVVMQSEELELVRLPEKVALVSQTTRKLENFLEIARHLIARCQEVRVFNTICNATFENQQSARELSSQVDIMIVVGGKNSSNTRQLLKICLENCADSYLVEDQNDLESQWFLQKNRCGVTAGASTPDWIIAEIVEKIRCF